MRLVTRAGCLVASALAALAVGLAPAAPAQAHAELLGSEPADGASLPQPPAEVLLRFNEPVELPPEPIRVFDADGSRVEGGDPGYGSDRSVLRAALRPDLPEGVYVVAWRAISADGHPVRGSVTFVVGEVPAADLAAAAPAVPEEDQTGWELAAGLVRWVTYAGTLLAAGGVAFLVLAYDRRPGERDRLVKVVGWATAAAVGGTIAGVPLQTVTVNGAGGASLGREALWVATLSSGYGASAAVRLCGLTVLLVGVLGLWVGSWARPVALAGALATLGSFLFSGHTATAQPRPLVWASHLSHTTAAAVWLGGLVLLALVLRARRRADDPVGGAQVVARFSVLAVGSVVAVAAAGTVLGWIEVRTWAGLTGTSYGLTLLAKAGLVAAVVAIGAYNNRRLVPAITAGAGAGRSVTAGAGAGRSVTAGAGAGRSVTAGAGAGRSVTAVTTNAGQAWQRLRRTVRWEAAVLLVGVVALTAVLVNLVPARNQVEAAETAPAGPFAGAEPLGNGDRVELTVDPARAGTNRLEVVLSGRRPPAGAAERSPRSSGRNPEEQAGAPVEAVERVELRLSLPAAHIEWITREPEPAGAGRWRHTGPELSIAGEWEVEVRVTVNEFERHTVTFHVPVAPAATGPPAQQHNHP